MEAASNARPSYPAGCWRGRTGIWAAHVAGAPAEREAARTKCPPWTPSCKDRWPLAHGLDVDLDLSWPSPPSAGLSGEETCPQRTRSRRQSAESWTAWSGACDNPVRRVLLTSRHGRRPVPPFGFEHRRAILEPDIFEGRLTTALPGGVSIEIQRRYVTRRYL